MAEEVKTDATAATTAAPATATTAAPATSAVAAATAAPETKPAVEGYWPADWSDRLSKGDEKRANVLKRFASVEALADGYIAANNRIRSGELKAALPANAKPEELAAWRKDNGIPEKHTEYDLKFDNGVVIGEEDKPVIDKFLEAAHGTNMRPEQVRAAVEWYYRNQETVAAETAKRDETHRQETLDNLNAEWGKDFRTNMNIVHSVLARFPTEVRDALEGARLPDGRGVFNHPEVIRAFASIGREINPAGILVPSGGGDIAKGLKDEITQIRGWMNSPRQSKEGKKYWSDESVQARYRELLDAESKLQKQAA